MSGNPAKCARLYESAIYQSAGVVAWHQITHWLELDFVKALPDDIKELLKEMPAESEATYHYCPYEKKMMPSVNPFHSRSYWLKHYNEIYEPIRRRNAKFAVIHAHTAFCASVERSLAHIAEVLEHLCQNTKHTHLELQELSRICQDVWEYDQSVKSGRLPPWV